MFDPIADALSGQRFAPLLISSQSPSSSQSTPLPELAWPLSDLVFSTPAPSEYVSAATEPVFAASAPVPGQEVTPQMVAVFMGLFDPPATSAAPSPGGTSTPTEPSQSDGGGSSSAGILAPNEPGVSFGMGLPQARELPFFGPESDGLAFSMWPPAESLGQQSDPLSSGSPSGNSPLVVGLIGDFVFRDLDGDGLQAGEANPEPGIADVTVRLLDAATQTVSATTTTDGAGLYQFTGVATGSYLIEFVAPEGATFTLADAGSDSEDSDANADTGRTEAFDYVSGESRLDIDCGLITSNLALEAADVGYELHVNEVIDTTGDAGLLPACFDANRDVLTAELVSGVSHGSLSFNPDGTFVYTPATNYLGADSFVYRITDGALWSNSAVVTFAVTDVAPTAGDQSFDVHANTPFTSLTPGVLNDASDDDQVDDRIAVLVVAPTHGTLTEFHEDGSFVYVPDPSFVGTDWFTFRATDGVLSSEPATAFLEVADNAPITADDVAYVAAGSALVNSSSVLGNDYDPDEDALTAELVGGPSFAASFTLRADGTFDYTPQGEFVGFDSFVYQARGAVAASPPTFVTLRVSDHPVPIEDVYLFEEGQSSLSVSAESGLLANDLFKQANTLAWLAAPPTFGSLSIQADEEGWFDGSFVYTPGPEFANAGVDSFTYAIDTGFRLETVMAHIVLGNWLTSKIKLSSVHYAGTGYKAVRQLSTNTVFSTEQPQLQDRNNNGVLTASENDIARPMSYARGTKLHVATATFKIDAADNRVPRIIKLLQDKGFLWMKGDAPGDTDVLAKQANLFVNEAQRTLAVFRKDAETAFEGFGYRDDFEVAWSISFAQGQGWGSVGRTRNRLYITYAAPKTSNLYESVLSQAGLWLPGPATEADVLFMLRSRFGSRQVQDIAGNALKYYGTWTIDVHNTYELLKNKDGRCDSWAEFFIDSARAQGLAMVNAKTKIQTPRARTGIFLVKNWHFLDNGLLKGLEFAGRPKGLDHVNVPKSPFIVANAYSWFVPGERVREDVRDQPGIPGQNVSNPESHFPNHVIVKLPGGGYFDPSYGVPYANMEALAAQLAGVGFETKFNEKTVDIDLNGDGQKNRVVFVHVLKPKPKAADLAQPSAMKY